VSNNVLTAPHPGRTSSDPGARERGSVTAETAVVLPALLLVLAMAVWVLAAVGTQLRCTDAAGVAARAAARGDSRGQVRLAGAAVAPAGSVIDVVTTTSTVEVRVRARVRPFGSALGALPAIEVSGRAVAALEDQDPAS